MSSGVKIVLQIFSPKINIFILKNESISNIFLKKYAVISVCLLIS